MIPILVIIVAILIAGCVSPTQNHPQPSGPSLSASTVISMADKRLSDLFEESQFLIPITYQNISSGACKWSGKDAGNASNWNLNFKAIVYNNISYYSVEGWILVRYSEGQFNVLSGPGMGYQWKFNNEGLNLSANCKTLQNNEINATKNESLASDFRGYIIDFDSYKVLHAAQPYKQYSDSIITLKMLAHNTNQLGPILSPVWEITWEYERSNAHKTKETVILAANNLAFKGHY